MKNIINKMENEQIREITILWEERFWMVIKQSEGVYTFYDIDLEYIYNIEEELRKEVDYLVVSDFNLDDFRDYYILKSDEEDGVREEMFDELYEKFKVFEGYYIVNKNIFKYMLL